MVTPTQFDNLVRSTCFAADMVALDAFHAAGMTNAEVTRVIIRRSLEFLIGNDLIEVKPEHLEGWLTLEPPFPHPVSADNAG
jgi:hypothetical protein